ncbi:hypothetical protein COOONC_26744 [Cooperia oncophora]
MLHTASGVSSGIRPYVLVKKAGLQDVFVIVFMTVLCTTPACVNCPFESKGLHGIVRSVRVLNNMLLFKEEYIGETSSPLRTRVKEHMGGMKKPKVATPGT